MNSCMARRFPACDPPFITLNAWNSRSPKTLSKLLKRYKGSRPEKKSGCKIHCECGILQEPDRPVKTWTRTLRLNHSWMSINEKRKTRENRTLDFHWLTKYETASIVAISRPILRICCVIDALCKILLVFSYYCFFSFSCCPFCNSLPLFAFLYPFRDKTYFQR